MYAQKLTAEEFKEGHMEKTDAVFARVAETFGIEYHNIDNATE